MAKKIGKLCETQFSVYGVKSVYSRALARRFRDNFLVVMVLKASLRIAHIKDIVA